MNVTGKGLGLGRVLCALTLVATVGLVASTPPAWAAAGDLDPAYGNGGKVTTDVGGVPQPPAVPSTPAEIATTGQIQSLGKLPLGFEANEGQTDGAVQFLARGAGYGLFLDSKGATLKLATHTDAVLR